ncbi:MAG: hypothetical protein ACQETI_07970 [Halobacteriota archaeon]
MTVIAVLADPPRPGLVLSELAATSPLTEAEAADLYTAILKDNFLAATQSGGDLLVNYRPAELLPEQYADDTDPEAVLRAIAADALDDLSDVRFETQVGSTFDARAGNTATHLLEREEVQSVAVVRGNAPLLARTDIDTAAMKLRSTPVVLGPAPAGRVYYAAFTDTIDFDGAFAQPELETLTARAGDAGHGVDFLRMLPVVERGQDLLTLLPLLRARRAAGRLVSRHTAAFVDQVGLSVSVDDGVATVVRDSPPTDSS